MVLSEQYQSKNTKYKVLRHSMALLYECLSFGTTSYGARRRWSRYAVHLEDTYVMLQQEPHLL